jgi:hypothetical protein
MDRDKDACIFSFKLTATSLILDTNSERKADETKTRICYR